ncbi:MAG: tRNA (adenosine(37)-N6)-dimethylallyltransferase MiaA [Desulfovibrionaceae bacterium]|nr:tRNA (adenosine(37)-N6)-dimethylallyltransferase MiaA [Desulfovibrionaceae bacterium]
MKKIVCLVGPTGCGKSALAVRLAQSVGGTIVNADSRQVYRDIPIVTAQPDAESLRFCPHRLYGFLNMSERISAGEWSSLAAAELMAAEIPILTGGTGMYLRALLDGMAAIPHVPRELENTLIERCVREGNATLHAELMRADPAYAEKIHPNDRQRIVRALSVLHFTGRRFSEWHKQTPPSAYPERGILRIGLRLPLEELKPILKQRIDMMLASGALEEIRAALEKTPQAEAPGWSGIGCQELRNMLEGRLTLDEASEQWLQNTRAYAKRQLTWFRADPRILWFAPTEADRAYDVAMRFLEEQNTLPC